MSESAQEAKTPWHLWVIGVVTLLFNLGGAYDYVQSKRLDEAYLSQAADAFGIGLDTVIAYFEAFPLWMNVFWAIGVWGAIAASVLLLLRSRFAYHAFIAELIGLLVAGFYQLTNPLEGADMTLARISAAVIISATILLIGYSKRMTARGVLR